MNLNQKDKTAILIFANSAKEEVKHKAIFKGLELFHALTNSTLKTVEKAGLPHYHFSEKQQVGITFGLRFTNAIQAIFDKGYENVITIGNDSPQLKPIHIVKAAQQLEAENLVLGPSLDGGFYLLGISKSHFNHKQFVDLPWQTSKIQKSILSTIKEVQVTYLPHLSDIDSFQDIKYIFNTNAVLSNEIKAIFIIILQAFRAINATITFLFNSIKFSTLFNKGSPNYLKVAF